MITTKITVVVILVIIIIVIKINIPTITDGVGRIPTMLFHYQPFLAGSVGSPPGMFHYQLSFTPL